MTVAAIVADKAASAVASSEQRNSRQCINLVYNVVLFLVYWHPWVPQNYCASISAPKTWAPNPAINGWDWETATRVMKSDVWPWQSHSCNLSGNFHISILCFNQIFDLLLISLYTKLWPLTWIESISVICRASMCVVVYRTVNFGRSDGCYECPSCPLMLHQNFLF